jgi:RNA binding exosome subunit
VEKIRKCLTFFCSDKKDVTVNEILMKGHYGNSIRRIVYTIDGQNAKASAEMVFRSLARDDRIRLLGSAELRLEGSKLFLRFSKFKAYYGKIVLTDESECIHMVMRFGGYVKGRSSRDLVSEVMRNSGVETE